MKRPKRIVVVGGIGSTEKVLEKTTRDCVEYCEADDADFFAFRRATGDQEEDLRKAVRGAHSVLTHSAGFVALTPVLENGKQPKSIVAASAPVRSNQLKLVGKTLARTVRDSIEQAAPSRDKSETGQRQRELVKEYIRGSGPINTHANIGNGKLRKIARFDSLARGGEIQRDLNVPVGFIYPEDDELFQPEPAELVLAEQNDGLYIRRIEGRHDDFLVATKRILGKAAIAAFLEDRIN